MLRSSGQKLCPDSPRMAVKDRSTTLGGPGEFRVLWMPNDSDQAVLGERAGSKRPCGRPRAKPVVRLVVLDVRRIDKGDEGRFTSSR